MSRQGPPHAIDGPPSHKWTWQGLARYTTRPCAVWQLQAYLCSAPQGNLCQARATNKWAGCASHNNSSVDQKAISRSCHAENVVTAVLAALRRTPVVKKQHRQALAIWLLASKELEAQQQARLKLNEPSARQRRGYVDFREVIKVRTALSKGSRQRLLLAFYTMMPPLRCDLNRVALLQCPASAATISQDDVDTVKENNFLCLPADRIEACHFSAERVQNCKLCWDLAENNTNESDPGVVDISAGWVA